MKKLLILCSGLVLGLSSGTGCSDPNPHRAGSGTGGGVGSGSGGSAASGRGGNVGSGGSGTGGADSGSGGTGVGGGASGTGGAGTAGASAGTGTGGAGTGGSGNGGASALANVIDNLDDGDSQILQVSGRQGPWHSFNDSNGGNQVPPVNGSFAPAIMMGGANGSPYAVHTTGSGYAMFGGVGFDLNNPTTTPGSSQCKPYDASAFNAITFWAKGNGNLRVEFPMRAFVPTDNGGACNASTTTCWNVYGSRDVQGMLTNDWKQFTILFSSNQREDGTKSPAFDPSQLMGIAFKHEGSTFDFWLDDIEFAKK